MHTDWTSKPILCLDFDGVIHSYSSGWKGADVIPDPPVAGAAGFMEKALDHFRVCIFSSRSNQLGGLKAMQDWMVKWMPSEVVPHFEWPTEKPAAMVTIDDRALTFNGTWPKIDDLRSFQPWYKRPFGATGTFPQGQLNDADQGGLKIGVAYDKLDGVVRVEFGKPVAWLGLPPPEAVGLAKLLLKHAGVKIIKV
jgi:hypothetical protein